MNGRRSRRGHNLDRRDEQQQHHHDMEGGSDEP
jgi:hypothetical protein